MSHLTHGLIVAARDFATGHHGGQTDKLGVPYVHHLEDVARRVGGSNEEVVAIAWLHDCVEDTAATLEEIEALFGQVIRDGVDSMTRRVGEGYFQNYLPRLMANPHAITVKIADASHNWGKVHLLRAIDPKKATSLDKKYRRVIEMLGAETDNLPELLAFDGRTGRWDRVK
ncbi:MAG: HD domain-containing protein [Alphaproteobacteria bacterium]